MRKFNLILLSCLIGLSSCLNKEDKENLETEKSHFLVFKMTELGSNSREMQPSPFPQYILCNKVDSSYSVRLDVYTELNGVNRNAWFLLKHDAGSIYETSETVNLEAGEVKIYGKTDSLFYLDWLNKLPNYSLFPQNTIVTEKWERIELDETADAIINTIMESMQEDSLKLRNRFNGYWENKYINTNQDTISFLKLYGEQYSIIFEPNNNNTNILRGAIRKVEYLSNNSIEEAGNACLIRWLGEDKFILTYYDLNNKPQTEIWDRVKVVDNFMKLEP